MIVGIQGGIGQGKTLVMTYLALQEHVNLGKPLFANYHLQNLPFEYITFKDFMRMAEEGYDFSRACILIDEAHVWVDSRMSASKLNRLFTYIMLQTGKADINMYYTTQDFGQVDKRLRQRTDVAIHVNRKGDNHLLSIQDFGQGIKARAIVYGPEAWPYYDTREVVKG